MRWPLAGTPAGVSGVRTTAPIGSPFSSGARCLTASIRALKKRSSRGMDKPGGG